MLQTIARKIPKIAFWTRKDGQIARFGNKNLTAGRAKLKVALSFAPYRCLVGAGTRPELVEQGL